MDTPKLTSRVRDLGMAAALLSCGFEICEDYKDGYGRAYFVFHQSPALRHAMSEYRADTLTVKARQFSDNIKMLKGLIYSDR